MGIIVGIVGCIIFVKVYYNYNVVSWVGVLVIFVIVFFYLYFVVCCDFEWVILRIKFSVIMWIGFGGMCFGIIGFIINIVFGVKNYEYGEFV